ncbi:hypothetical protein LTR37_017254 [Vermiconidia calcicola]|uniref:Uncharacterized protein n=1 Tax=Vermiconidia calcicola TaxID=1690605 RepID=A0ACC3MKV7_9PEZI|nr:hypothetical protein LTR37_017254 [Vermiconidia calcicola]
MKYNIPNLESSKYQRPSKRKRDTDDKEGAPGPKVPKAVLSLKTYDPESGVCLQFKTDRAADVGRLIGGVGRLGRHMAALPQKTEDTVMEEAPGAEQAKVQERPPAASPAVAPASDGKAQSGSGGGGKKKKKGKK